MIALHNHEHVPFLVVPIMYFIGVAVPSSLTLRWKLSASNLASLYAWPDKKQVDKIFLLLPIPMLPSLQPSPFLPRCFYIPCTYSSFFLRFDLYLLPLLVKFFCNSTSRHRNLYYGTDIKPFSIPLTLFALALPLRCLSLLLCFSDLLKQIHFGNPGRRLKLSNRDPG